MNSELDLSALGAQMYAFAEDIINLPRSLTGEGCRATLKKIQSQLPGLQICSVKCSEPAFDWTVPPEWQVREAYIEVVSADPQRNGRRLCQFKDNYLHLVGYSMPYCSSDDSAYAPLTLRLRSAYAPLTLRLRSAYAPLTLRYYS